MVVNMSKFPLLMRHHLKTSNLTSENGVSKTSGILELGFELSLIAINDVDI